MECLALTGCLITLSGPVWLGGWGVDARRRCYLSCDDHVKPFPQLKLPQRKFSLRKCRNRNFSWDLEEEEVRLWLTNGEGQTELWFEGIGPKTRACWVRAKGATASSTSLGTYNATFCPLLDLILPMARPLGWRHLWTPGSPTSGMSAWFPRALSMSFLVLKW